MKKQSKQWRKEKNGEAAKKGAKRNNQWHIEMQRNNERKWRKRQHQSAWRNDIISVMAKNEKKSGENENDIINNGRSWLKEEIISWQRKQRKAEGKEEEGNNGMAHENNGVVIA